MFRAVVKFSVSSKNVLDALTCKSSRRSLYRYPLSCLDHCFSYNSYPLISPNLGDSKFADPTETFWPLLHMPFFPFSSTFYAAYICVTFTSCSMVSCQCSNQLHQLLLCFLSSRPIPLLPFKRHSSQQSPDATLKTSRSHAHAAAHCSAAPATCAWFNNS